MTSAQHLQESWHQHLGLEMPQLRGNTWLERFLATATEGRQQSMAGRDDRRQ